MLYAGEGPAPSPAKVRVSAHPGYDHSRVADAKLGRPLTLGRFFLVLRFTQHDASVHWYGF